MSLNILKCPNCDSTLLLKDRSFICPHNHVFDLSKEGYLNLLLPNQKKAKLPGDNKQMIQNREAFLSLGYYKELSTYINARIHTSIKDGLELNLLDLGCGSGYYVRNILAKSINKYGLDISKYAISKAAKLDKNTFHMVSSYKRIPIMDHSIHIVLNNFAPIDLQEVSRILQVGGKIIKVVPYRNHMQELAQHIYQDFVPHTSDFKDKIEKCKKLNISTEKVITYRSLLTQAEALNLIRMTPYLHKFKMLDIELPKNIEVTFSFLILEAIKD